MNHVNYVKNNKAGFSKYIWNDSEHYKKISDSTMLSYMMKYSKEFFIHDKRMKFIDILLKEDE